MADSAIQWTDKVWNPTVGCTRVSPGCEHCYAESLAPRLAAMGQPVYEGLTRKHGDGSVNWTGEVRCLPERLTIPFGWRKPQRIFVNSMSDLFHESVPDSFIAQVFAVMSDASQQQGHTFQVLTKRPDRMRDLVTRWAQYDDSDFNEATCELPLSVQERIDYDNGIDWPIPNVWLGVSAENQAVADERIPLLLQTPAAVRFVSAEPLLGPIDFVQAVNKLDGLDPASLRPGGIDWCIVGGESGANHRPMELDWARGIRDTFVRSGSAFFFKQVGGRTPKAGGRLLDGVEWNQFPGCAQQRAETAGGERSTRDGHDA